MDEKDWTMFKIVAEEKSITQAAEKLFVSQPALSYRLKNLEAEIGARLLLRTTNGILLTPQGEVFLDHIDKLCRDVERMKDHIKSIGATTQGPLHVGCSCTFAYYELVPSLHHFVDKYPEVKVHVRTALSDEVLRMLEREEIAVGVLRGDYPWREERMQLLEEPICLVYHKSLSLEELTVHPRLSFITDTPLTRDTDLWLKEQFGMIPPPAMFLDSIETCRQFVKNKLGWAILPEMGLEEMKDSFYVKPLYHEDGTPFVRKTELFYRKEAMNLPAVNAFIDFMREHYQGSAQEAQKS